jgi:hypothetical protein
MGQPYTISVDVQNPDEVNAHTYTLQLKEECNTQNYCFTQQGISFPSWEQSGASLIGVPTQWQTDPTCMQSGAWLDVNVNGAYNGNCMISANEGQQTVAPGQTATFTFTFTNKWAWIPAWNWKFLAATVESFGFNVVPTTGIASIISHIEQVLSSSYSVPLENFDFQLMSGGVQIATHQSTVIVGPLKLAAYTTVVFSSITASIATGTVFEECATVIGCTIAPWDLGYEAITLGVENLAYIGASDPSMDYTQVVQPSSYALLNGTLVADLPAFQSLSSDQVILLQTLANVASLENATVISITRYTGALEAGSQYYASLQLQAIQNYASQRDQLMSQFVDLLSRQPSPPPFNSTSIQNLRNFLEANGLPSIEQQILNGLGLSSSIPDVVAGLTLFNATTLNEFTFLRSLQIIQSMMANETAIWTSKQVSLTHPTILLNPSSAGSGTTVLVSGSVFSLSDSTCSLSGTAAGDSDCSISGGMLSGSFVVGNVASGSYMITATGSSGDSASTTLSVSIGTSSQTSQASVLKVWFDIPYFLDTLPCSYQLVVHAQTTNGLSIINLHWDWGDGSTLDVPFAGSNQVTDSRTHGYVNAGTYVVSVTATDSAGNTGIGYWGLDDAFPASCQRPVGTAGVTPPTSNGTATASATGHPTILKLKITETELNQVQILSRLNLNIHTVLSQAISCDLMKVESQ